MYRRIVSAIRYLLRKPANEQELDAELRFHFDLLVEQNTAQGMTPEAARRAARITVGGMEQIKDECRDARLGHTFETLLQDLHYGLRTLWKNPGFTSMAILTLALGIGVNTAIFSVVYGVLLRPLPYQRGGQLVVLHQQAPLAHLDDIPFSFKEIVDYRGQNHTLDGVVEHHTMVFLLLGKDTAERVNTAVVSANFFDVLGVRPLHGRTFIASDEDEHSNAVLVLSYKYWKSRFGGDPNLVGQVFQMNNRPHTVIGILPPIPQYPTESDVYMPTSQCPTRSSAGFKANRDARMMTVFGRLKPGVELPKAQADLSTIGRNLANTYPGSYPKAYGYALAAAPLQDDLTRRARPTFLVLLAASGFVLLISCANVANLLLARLLKVERELAVRSALGATRGRLLRQLLTESLLLSLTGGLLGLALAPPTVHLLAQFAERFTTRAGEIHIDAPVLLFAFLISIATGILFGLAPAFSARIDLADALKQGAGRTTATRGRQRLRAALVITQVAVSFMLLIGAGLMIRSFQKLQEENPGFNSTRLLSLRLTPNFSHYQQSQLPTLERTVLAKVRALGGVESAALASNFPFNPGGLAAGPGTVAFQIEGRPVSKGELAPLADQNNVSDGYFETIHQPLVDGRTFTPRDDEHAPPVAILNQSIASHRWPSENPVGKRISFDNGVTWIKVVGIVRNAKEYGLNRPVGDEVYMPTVQSGLGTHLVVRTSFEPMTVSPLIRAALLQVDSQLAIDQVETVTHLEDEYLASPRVTTMLLGLFAGLALLVSASGIAAVIALAVRQRSNELGIRLALGATQESILLMVVRQGVLLAVCGAVLGVGGALVLTRLLASLLYATSPTDTATFAAVTLLFLGVAIVASFIPARQVTSIDPLTALRQE
jgi:putative ABC transport system permease protein